MTVDIGLKPAEIGTWVEGYKKAIADALVTKGKIGDRSEYGFAYDEHLCAHYGVWRDRYEERWADDKNRDYLISERRQHPGQAIPAPQWCGGWKSILDLKEEHTSEFAGTFTSDREFVRVTAQVTCSCGYIKDREIERDSTFAELLREVLQ